MFADLRQRLEEPFEPQSGDDVGQLGVDPRTLAQDRSGAG